MDERERQQRVWDVESILSDVTDNGDDPDGRGYQASGITKLAELLVGYERRIAELEGTVAALRGKAGDSAETQPAGGGER